MSALILTLELAAAGAVAWLTLYALSGGAL
jgi:hypothetical protein